MKLAITKEKYLSTFVALQRHLSPFVDELAPDSADGAVHLAAAAANAAAAEGTEEAIDMDDAVDDLPRVLLAQQQDAYAGNRPIPPFLKAILLSFCEGRECSGEACKPKAFAAPAASAARPMCADVPWLTHG
ncbi:hypothetical protein Esti_000428 [Eimeria stiedai]